MAWQLAQAGVASTSCAGWQVAQAAKNAVYQLASLKEQVLLAEKGSRYMSENLKHVQEAVVSGAMTSSAETMEAFAKQTYVSPYFIAQMYAYAGNKEKAMGWLEKGYEMRDPMMPYIHASDFDLLDEVPRYQDLLQRMNLPAGK